MDPLAEIEAQLGLLQLDETPRLAELEDLPEELVQNVLDGYARKIEVALNNLANVDTPAYKRGVVQFAAGGAQESKSPQGGSCAEAVWNIQSPGRLGITGRELDVAIDGGGFFQVTLPDGSTAYTRDGRLRIDRDGALTTFSGARIQPEITLPTDLLQLNIDHEGRVTGRLASNPDSTTSFGQLQLARFSNPASLRYLDSNLFRASDAAGSPIVAFPGSSGAGLIKQGFIELSNVDEVRELVELRKARLAQHRLLRTLGIE